MFDKIKGFFKNGNDKNAVASKFDQENDNKNSVVVHANKEDVKELLTTGRQVLCCYSLNDADIDPDDGYYSTIKITLLD